MRRYSAQEENPSHIELTVAHANFDVGNKTILLASDHRSPEIEVKMARHYCSFLRQPLLMALVLLLTVGSAGADGPFKVLRVELPRMAKVHLCRSLGGAAQRIPVLVTHTAVAGHKITVQMRDRTSSGAVINHRATTVVANASGRTTVNFNFIPPCNRSGVSTSNYSFTVTGGGGPVTKLFGSYDSARRVILGGG
jgi:hypothetical protein